MKSVISTVVRRNHLQQVMNLGLAGEPPRLVKPNLSLDVFLAATTEKTRRNRRAQALGPQRQLPLFPFQFRAPRRLLLESLSDLGARRAQLGPLAFECPADLLKPPLLLFEILLGRAQAADGGLQGVLLVSPRRLGIPKLTFPGCFGRQEIHFGSLMPLFFRFQRTLK